MVVIYLVCDPARGGCGYEDDIHKFPVNAGNVAQCPKCQSEKSVRLADRTKQFARRGK